MRFRNSEIARIRFIPSIQFPVHVLQLWRQISGCTWRRSWEDFTKRYFWNFHCHVVSAISLQYLVFAIGLLAQWRPTCCISPISFRRKRTLGSKKVIVGHMSISRQTRTVTFTAAPLAVICPETKPAARLRSRPPSASQARSPWYHKIHFWPIIF